jgi:hypothetical protein
MTLLSQIARILNGRQCGGVYVSSKADYTAAEWALLSELPIKVAIGAAIVEFDNEGIAGGDREMLAAMKEIAAGEDRFTDNALIQAILQELKVESGEDDDAREIEIPGGEAWTALIDDLLDRARETNALLAAKSTPDEAAGVKRWLLNIAGQATTATKSGGFLGFGAERVSAQEKTFLRELATALDVQS